MGIPGLAETLYLYWKDLNKIDPVNSKVNKRNNADDTLKKLDVTKEGKDIYIDFFSLIYEGFNTLKQNINKRIDIAEILTGENIDEIKKSKEYFKITDENLKNKIDSAVAYYTFKHLFDYLNSIGVKKKDNLYIYLDGVPSIMKMQSEKSKIIEDIWNYTDNTDNPNYNPNIFDYWNNKKIKSNTPFMKKIKLCLERIQNEKILNIINIVKSNGEAEIQIFKDIETKIKTEEKYNAYVLSNDADCLLISMRLCSKYKDLNIKIFNEILYDINSINKKIYNTENPSLETGTKSTDLIHTLSIILIACYGCDFSYRFFEPTEYSINYLIELLKEKKPEIYDNNGLCLKALYQFISLFDTTNSIKLWINGSTYFKQRNEKAMYVDHRYIYSPECDNGFYPDCIEKYLQSLKFVDNFFSLDQMDLATVDHYYDDFGIPYSILVDIIRNTSSLGFDFDIIKKNQYDTIFGDKPLNEDLDKIKVERNNLSRSIYTDFLSSISDVYSVPVSELEKVREYHHNDFILVHRVNTEVASNGNRFLFIEPPNIDEPDGPPPDLNVGYLKYLSDFYSNKYPELIN